MARKSGPNRATALLQDQGWCVLENTAQPVAAETTPLWIAGIASQRAFPSGPPLMRQYHRLDDLPKTLSQVPADAPLLLMAHEPDIFTELPNRPVLTVSGHTHGAQIRVAGRAIVTPSRYGNRFAHGLRTSLQSRPQTLDCLWGAWLLIGAAVHRNGARNHACHDFRLKPRTYPYLRPPPAFTVIGFVSLVLRSSQTNTRPRLPKGPSAPSFSDSKYPRRRH
ncbi:MAG: hypothetical protein ACI8R4_001939 [Paracoccaceae bacterium]|jgi:hypothetical protein